MVPPVSAICGSWPLLWASVSRVSSSPAIAVASASADSCTSIRGGDAGRRHSDLLLVSVFATAA